MPKISVFVCDACGKRVDQAITSIYPGILHNHADALLLNGRVPYEMRHKFKHIDSGWIEDITPCSYECLGVMIGRSAAGQSIDVFLQMLTEEWMRVYGPAFAKHILKEAKRNE